jgi:hypothetical protein
MDRKPLLGVFTALAVSCLIASSAGAAVQSKCLAGKNKCISKKAGALLKCHQKAETPNKPADPNFKGCVDKAMAKFDGTPNPSKGCFEKLENKSGNDCVTFDDTASAEVLVDNCIDELVQAIDPGAIDQTKCGAGKKKCVAKKLKSLLKCYQKAQTPGKPMDPNYGGCIDKAKAKYDGGSDTSKGCFVKLETKTGNDCLPPTGNQAALEDIVDDSCVAAFVALLENPTTSTTTTTTSTTTTSTTTTSTTTTSTTTITTSTTTTSTTTTSTTTITTSTTTTSTTTTTTTSTTTSSTTTTTTSSTTTTTMGGSPTMLDFTTGTPGGICGTAKNASLVVVKNLTCGGLNIGGGSSLVGEGGVPSGAISRFALACVGPACTIGPNTTVPAVNTDPTIAPDCTNTGCFFGPPLPIPNMALPPLTTCIINTWSAPAGGTLNLGTGALNSGIPLTSDVYLTGNLAQPCPRCSGSGTPGSPGTGTCDRGPRTGLACTTTNPNGASRDCPTGGVGPSKPCDVPGSQCVDGSKVGPIGVTLSPLTTGTASASNGSGVFCPGQTMVNNGCFGQHTCTSFSETGSPSGALSSGVPASATLAATFCIPATANASVNSAGGLPGPGAVSLPGTVTVN